MRSGVVLVSAALVAAACTTGDVERALPAADPPAGTTSVPSATTTPAAVTSAPPPSPATSDAVSSSPTTNAADTTTVPSPGAASADPTTTTSESSGPAPDGDPAESELDLAARIAAEDFEPVIDIGESVVLDVDVARFPVDDAGQGGGVSGDGADSDDAPGDDVGDPDSGSSDPIGGFTGWAGFNASLEAALLRPGNTSAAVAVMIGGELVNTAAFGVRDPARGDSAQPTDRWRIASISKPITAIVALDLVEQGLVGLDDPIGGVIASHVGAEQVSGGARQLTLRRLLSHTSGYGREYTTFFQLGADDCPDAARQGLARGAGSGGYQYSNMNYCLAGMLIEALTGESLERATYRALLTPLGISGMRLAPTVDPGPGEAQHRTTPGRAYMETLGGAGSWIASPIDLVRIVDSLDASTSGFAPLDQETVVQMLTPTGGTLGQRGYGLGVISYGGGRIGHTGTIEATHAMVLNRGDGVIWAVTVAGDHPVESERLEQFVDAAFAAGGFVAG